MTVQFVPSTPNGHIKHGSCRDNAKRSGAEQCTKSNQVNGIDCSYHQISNQLKFQLTLQPSIPPSSPSVQTSTCHNMCAVFSSLLPSPSSSSDDPIPIPLFSFHSFILWDSIFGRNPYPQKSRIPTLKHLTPLQTRTCLMELMVLYRMDLAVVCTDFCSDSCLEVNSINSSIR